MVSLWCDVVFAGGLVGANPAAVSFGMVGAFSFGDSADPLFHWQAGGRRLSGRLGLLGITPGLVAGEFCFVIRPAGGSSLRTLNTG